MDTSTINHKIKKYTKKLIASKNTSQAILYQGKLREYTHIQSGGAPFKNQSITNSVSKDRVDDTDTSSTDTEK